MNAKLCGRCEREFYTPAEMREAWDDADELAAALEETERWWGGNSAVGDDALAAHRKRMEKRWPKRLRRKAG